MTRGLRFDLSRRGLLKSWTTAGLTAGLGALLGARRVAANRGARHGGMGTVGVVDPARNGFDPHALLTDWDTGR